MACPYAYILCVSQWDWEYTNPDPNTTALYNRITALEVAMLVCIRRGVPIPNDWFAERTIRCRTYRRKVYAILSHHKH